MSDGSTPPPNPLDLSETSRRRWWFDYLGRLSDRQMQQARAWGLTPWALLAVAAAVIYKSVPYLPRMIATPGLWESSLILLILAVDACIHLGWFALGVIAYCRSEVKPRLLTEQRRRVIAVIEGTLTALLLPLAAAHFELAGRCTWSIFASRVLWGFGIFWALNFALALRKNFKRRRQSKRYGISFPAFTEGQTFRPLLAGLALGIGIVPAAALLLFVRGLSRASGPWLLALGAATHMLILGGLVAGLFIWGLHAPVSDVYPALERDILLEELSSDEIRTRFVSMAYGPSIGEWLEKLETRYADGLATLRSVTDSMASHLKEIDSIDPQCKSERKSRAKSVLADEMPTIKSVFDKVQGVCVELKELKGVAVGLHDGEILKRVLERVRSEAETQLTPLSRAAAEAGRRLMAISKNGE